MEPELEFPDYVSPKLQLYSPNCGSGRQEKNQNVLKNWYMIFMEKALISFHFWCWTLCQVISVVVSWFLRQFYKTSAMSWSLRNGIFEEHVTSQYNDCHWIKVWAHSILIVIVLWPPSMGPLLLSQALDKTFCKKSLTFRILYLPS